MHVGGSQGRKITIVAFAIVSLFIFSSIHGALHQSVGQQAGAGPSMSSAMSDVSFIGGISNSTTNYTGNMNVLVMFNFSNQNALNSLLINLSNPLSPQYGHFLTAAQFNSEFSPKASVYNSAANYFRQYGINVKETFQNRVLLSLDGTSGNISRAFNTTITSTGPVAAFNPSSQPELPNWLAGSVSNVIGLSSIKPTFNLNIANLRTFTPPNNGPGSNAVKVSNFTYPDFPQSSNGVQFLYGSYFQGTYNEIPLLHNVTPSGAVIASILWGGSYTSNGNTIYTAPYNPSDISYYFNKTILSQPKPKVYGVPVGGAVAPGTSSQLDTSGAVVENTLDMEMLGSTAPGASIYNVYGPNGTLADLTTAFETIMSPPSQDSPLNNVSVISNSWGTNDFISQTWNQLLQESQARGITVLASSGDSGNDLSSPKSVSQYETVQFPSTISYDTYGVTAVGGTNISISTSNLALQAQQVWYQPGTDSNGGTLGTVGGISNNYSEPTWQINSQANQVIDNRGRGVPDFSAVANNTLIYFSNTTKASYYVVAGTSISAPVLAGIIAEIDQYRTMEGQSWLGFLNPSIYRLGTEQYDPSMAGGYTPPLLPFYDVTVGHNYNYQALPGYDLVTGMGSVNAYNLMTDLTGKKYNVSFMETGMNPANSWSVEVSGIYHGSEGAYVNFTLINGSYNYKVPVVGHNVSDPVAGNFTVNGSNITINLQFKRGYTVDFRQSELPPGEGWTMKVWNYTESSVNRSMVLYFPNGTYDYSAFPSDPNYYGSSGNFTVNGSSQTVAVNFTRGIFNVTFIEQGLPPLQAWSVTADNATKSTQGNNLTFTLLGGEYSFTIHPSGKYIANRTHIVLNTNGANRTVHLNFSYGYFIKFVESGVPAGVPWTVVIADYNVSSTNTSITVEVQNGSYSYMAYFHDGSIGQHLSSTVNVTGSNVTVNLSFTIPRTLSQYYVLYGTLFILGVVVLVIGLLMMRKK